MVFAIGRGVPEAGLAFAVAMMTGIAFTLALVALIAVLARESLMGFFARNQQRLRQASSVTEGIAGMILVFIGVNEIFFR